MYPSPQKRIFLSEVRFENFLSEVRFELTDVPPTQKKNFLSGVRFELTNVSFPPEKNFYAKLDLSQLMYPPPPE